MQNEISDFFGASLNKKNEITPLLGILYLLGLAVTSTYLYSKFFAYEKETNLLYNEAVPITIRAILVLGIPIAFAIGLSDLIKGRLPNSLVSFLLVTMLIFRLWL